MTVPQVCSFCVMDTSAKDIRFDEQGECNYCRDYRARHDQVMVDAQDPERRAQFIERVKKDGRGKEYDCIVGVSGGVDSSYSLYLAVEHGLRPLAVHLDNGWNSELASHNIANLVTRLNVDLYTHVIDWEENRDLQRSFFAAHVIDIELLMDNAMFAANFRQARKYGVKYILSGSNSVTEGISMPGAWNNYKWDARNIRNIHKKFGDVPIKTHLLYSTFDHMYDKYVRGIEWVPFLDYFDYNKAQAVQLLTEKCGYKPYVHKHYESVFTRFYQAYILPQKFGVDKRRLHLSALIASGQETRENAMRILREDPYPDADQKREDTTFVLKKLGFSETDFARYIQTPSVPHADYGSEEQMMKRFGRIYKKLRAMKIG